MSQPSTESGSMSAVAVSEVSWSEVLRRLAPARNYWLSTVGPTGAPHVAPVWGVAVEDTLYLYSERRTIKARNLRADPRAALHLESADDVVIVHGVLDDVGRPAAVPAVVRALADKYTAPADTGFLPSNDPDFDVVYALRPRSALLWRLADYETSQRRWSAS